MTDKIKQVRLLQEEFNNLQFREYCYNKHKHSLPVDLYFLNTKTEVEVRELLVAMQVYYRPEIEKLLSGRENKQDLVNLLSTPKYSGLKDKSLLRKPAGMDFLKSYIIDSIYKTSVKGAESNPLKLLDNVKVYHRAICNAFILTGKTTLTASGIAACLRFVAGTNVVSNFRPISACEIWQRYGVDKTTEKDVYLLAPSEGFLGRLLSSYKLAKDNPDRNIHYHSFDPNVALKQGAERLIKDLRPKGFNRKSNWFPVIHWHGSEVREARLDLQFDVIFTSPPYAMHETYISCETLHLASGEASFDEIEAVRNGKTTENTLIVQREASGVKVGDVIVYNDKTYSIVKVDLTQSHTLAKTGSAWRELFFRPTIKNCVAMLKDGGYCLWNVANTTSAPNLEKDVVEVCTEEGLGLIDTLRYEISRRPGARMKADYELVFVFQKKG